MIQWDSIICQGSESDITECLKTQPKASDAYTDIRRDAGVICSESRSVQLVDGPGHCAGTVQVYHRGQRSMVSGDSWTTTEADVVCKELKCGRAINATTVVKNRVGNVWLKDDGNQGKHRVTKRDPALSYPMFTLVTSEDIAESVSHTPIQRCLRGVQRPNKVLDFLPPDQRQHSRILIAAACHTGRYR
ncbi:unnamed protein product [Ranitomeya imitator]|uniref:SRCR domain-containing protein n=1 Tax=Ranitomeya imitator TaxID=111125 RepID=A0ABN9LXK5_9NEOB|nr:unnamed protein product [Ranitomeya imitator]